MNCQEIIAQLKSMASEKYKANVVKMGVPDECSIGVSTGEIRKFAKTIGKSNALAHELWETGYHEARILAVLVFDKKQTTIDEAALLMKDVVSWDLCDHLCKNLLIYLDGYEPLITQWASADYTYVRRAAFTLMASSVIHKKDMTCAAIDRYLLLIREYSQDERDHVKKAVSWALREIGKKDFDANEKAIILAHELLAEGNKAQKWIAKDALKELENLVK